MSHFYFFGSYLKDDYEIINLVNPECDKRRKAKVVIFKNDMEVIM